jgi:hypothetical protein
LEFEKKFLEENPKLWFKIKIIFKKQLKLLKKQFKSN